MEGDVGAGLERAQSKREMRGCSTTIKSQLHGKLGEQVFRA